VKQPNKQEYTVYFIVVPLKHLPYYQVVDNLHLVHPTEQYEVDWCSEYCMHNALVVHLASAEMY